MKVMDRVKPGGTSFMEDYTYHMPQKVPVRKGIMARLALTATGGRKVLGLS